MLALGLILILLSLVSYWKSENISRLIFSVFLVLGGVFFILVGLLSRSQFYLTVDSLILTNIIGVGKKKILFTDIEKTKFVSTEFPITAFLNNLLWLFLWDRKFKRITKLKIFSKGRLVGTVDGHFLENSEFEKLKRKLEK